MNAEFLLASKIIKESMEKEFSWYKLDNAAKVFPDTSGKNRPNMFRICMNLNETVDGEVLQEAVASLKSRFPTFFVKIKKGLFWYYYEYNEKTPIVSEEPSHICMLTDKKRNNDFLFNVYYYKTRISVEVFHALSDGTGVVEFTKSIVFRYLQLKGYPVECEGLVKTFDSNPLPMEIEDSFLKNYDDSGKGRDDDDMIFARMASGTVFGEKEGMGVINGKCSVESLKSLAKQYDCTITAYMSAVALYSMYKADFKNDLYSKLPIKLVLPVNLRNYYESKTLRNFSLVMYLSLNINGRAWTFDDILKIVKDTMKQKLTKVNIQRFLNSNVQIEKNYTLKLVPLFIKKYAIKIGYNKMGAKLATCSLSNLGEIKLPKTMKPYVNDIEWNLSTEYFPSYNITTCSYDGKMTITFNRSIYETEVMMIFFRYLAKQGVDVTIESNLWEEHA